MPGANQYPYQANPVEILNGTINVGVISYTPTNGESLGGQNFGDINFGSTPEAVPAIAFARPQAVANAVINSTANAQESSITGRVYLDGNMNSRFDDREPSLGGLVLYLDLDHDGRYHPADDPSATADDQGYYEFSGLQPGRTYTIRIANLPGSYFFNPVTVTMPAAGTVSRFIGVNEYWSLPQANITVDPLTAIDLELAPLSLRNSLEIRPFYQLIGNIPEGMTIDPDTGEILWTPSMDYANSTVTIMVKIQNSADRSANETQINAFAIHINAISPAAAFVRDVYGDLLLRQPTSQEVSYWTSKLQSGTSKLAFANGVAQSDERYAILADNVYLTVLSRSPTASELAGAMTLFQSGGNSDQLTVDLLTSPAFLQMHPGNLDYVNAVNQILTFKDASRAITRMEVAWLKAGGSRARLVNRILHSAASTRARAAQLSALYFGGPSASKTMSQWSTALSRGTLNTDTLTALILASDPFVDGVGSRLVPNTQTSRATGAEQYNRLDHLQFMTTGSDATRSQLDSMELQLYRGQTWQSVAKTLYNGQAAFDARVQTQYENLLNRPATSGELSSLLHSLPAANQTQALQDQILAGSEYRAQFSTTTDYVNAVFRVLTGSAPDSSAVRFWTHQLQDGLPTTEFVQTVASSQAGKIGQITRLYSEYLLRDPSQSEVTYWLDQYPESSPQDRPIAISLINSDEFRQQQRRAALVPTN